MPICVPILICYSLSLLVSASVRAMDLEGMRTIAGIEIIDQRMDEVLDAYGVPAAITERGIDGRIGKSVKQWRGAHPDLPAGDWEVVYETGGESDTCLPPSTCDRPGAMMSLQLAGVSRLVLQAKDGIGILTVRRAPAKTTYVIPEDPLRAHKVIRVRTEFREPLSPAAVVARYGEGYEDVREEGLPGRMRYWVLVLSGEVPLNLYAVDFELDANNDAVACEANTTHIDFVLSKLRGYYAVWEKNLSD